MYAQDAARELANQGIARPARQQASPSVSGPAGVLGGVIGALAAGIPTGGMGALEGAQLGAAAGSGLGGVADTVMQPSPVTAQSAAANLLSADDLARKAKVY